MERHKAIIYSNYDLDMALGYFFSKIVGQGRKTGLKFNNINYLRCPTGWWDTRGTAAL